LKCILHCELVDARMPTGYCSNLFYCVIVDLEVTDSSGSRFSNEASEHVPDLFHWSLTTEFRDIRSRTVTFILLNSSASLCSKMRKFARFKLVGLL